MEDVFDSLWMQSLKRIEIIVVNDGSSPEATSTMEKLVDAQGDARIRVVSHSKNRGLSAARNTGIANANTECIFLLFIYFFISFLFFFFFFFLILSRCIFY
jgi:glycosyltransferase involved in cell wall biosynthesis